MPTRLRWYVGSLCVAGGFVLVYLMTRLDFVRAREVAPAIAVFGAFMIVGELVILRVNAQNRLKEVSITATFAYGLVALAGTGMAVLVFLLGSVISDLGRRKGAIKTLFNAAQYVLALAAGGAVYHALGGGYEITTATLPALAAGGLVFMLINYLLVSTVVSIDQGVPVLQGLRRDDLRLELGSSAMVLALAPVAVVVAERSLLLVPALVVPLAAVFAGLGGGAPGQGPAGGGRGGDRAPAPPHRARARGRPPPPGDRPAQGRPDRHRLPRAAQPPDHDRRRVRHPAGPAPSAQPGRA